MIRWIRRLIFQRGGDRQLRAELRFHLDQQAADFMDRGINQEEAYRRAAIAMGGLEQVRQRCRDRRWENYLQGLSSDLRLALTVVAGLAMFDPVRKAIRVDPVAALREQ